MTSSSIAALVYLGVNGCILLTLDAVARLASSFRPNWREQLISSAVLLLFGIPLMLVVFGKLLFTASEPSDNL